MRLFVPPTVRAMYRELGRSAQINRRNASAIVSMNNSIEQSLMLSEINKRVHKVIVFTKVEKYIRVGNQWLLEASGKALDQVHKAVQMIKRGELEEYLQLSKAKVAEYLNMSKQRLLETPERALVHAYSAAVLLKKIEDIHLAGNKVTSISSGGDNVSTYFQIASNKYLILIQVRLLEFRASHWIIPTQHFNQLSLETNDESSAFLEKLKFIDDVLAQHFQAQPKEQSGLMEESIAATKPTPEPIVDSFNPAIGDLMRDPWKLFGAFHLPSEEADNSFHLPSEEADNHQIPQTTVTTEPQSPFQLERQPLPLRSAGNLAANLKLASILFAGGFLTGGVCFWALASAQNPEAASSYSNSREAHLDLVTSETSAEPIAPYSSPERMPPESSVSTDHPTHQIALRAALQQVSETMQPDPSSQPTHPDAIVRPSVVAALLAEIEFSTSRTTPQQTTDPHTLTSTSSSLTQQRKLTSADLQNYSAWELTLLRNEIYARHGRIFRESELRRYFESQHWYQPRHTPSEFPVSLLSETEMHNAILIRDYQYTHGML